MLAKIYTCGKISSTPSSTGAGKNVYIWEDLWLIQNLTSWGKIHTSATAGRRDRLVLVWLVWQAKDVRRSEWSLGIAGSHHSVASLENNYIADDGICWIHAMILHHAMPMGMWIPVLRMRCKPSFCSAHSEHPYGASIGLWYDLMGMKKEKRKALSWLFCIQEREEKLQRTNLECRGSTFFCDADRWAVFRRALGEEHWGASKYMVNIWENLVADRCVYLAMVWIISLETFEHESSESHPTDCLFLERSTKIELIVCHSS